MDTEGLKMAQNGQFHAAYMVSPQLIMLTALMFVTDSEIIYYVTSNALIYDVTSNALIYYVSSNALTLAFLVGIF